MSDIFHNDALVNFQPRTDFRVGTNWPFLLQAAKCIHAGKYCMDLMDDYGTPNEAEGATQTEIFLHSPRGMIEQVFREHCVFEALEGQKSHWFRYMDILLDGCAVHRNHSNPHTYQLITPECNEKAMKFTQIYSQFNRDKYDACVNDGLANLDAQAKERYDSPRSQNFLDRDFEYRKDFSNNIQNHPMITINGDPYKGNYMHTDELFSLICSRLQNRPEACTTGGLIAKKKKIREEFEAEWGEDGSPERAAIVIEKLKEAVVAKQGKAGVTDRNSTKLDLTLLLVFFVLATVACFLVKNYRDKNMSNQQMHEAVNAQVSSYFQLTNQGKDPSQNN